MTDIDKKREQIQEGFSIHLYNRFELVKEGVKWFVATEQARQYFRQVTRSLFAQLHLQDVAIKVDGELPMYPGATRSDPEWIPPEEIFYLEAQQTMLKAGYVVVESLIDRGRDEN